MIDSFVVLMCYSLTNPSDDYLVVRLSTFNRMLNSGQTFESGVSDEYLRLGTYEEAAIACERLNEQEVSNNGDKELA